MRPPASYTKLLGVLPDLTVLHLQIGNAYRAIGADDEALAAYEALVAVDPSNVDAKTEIERTKKNDGGDGNLLGQGSLRPGRARVREW